MGVEWAVFLVVTSIVAIAGLVLFGLVQHGGRQDAEVERDRLRQQVDSALRQRAAAARDREYWYAECEKMRAKFRAVAEALAGKDGKP